MLSLGSLGHLGPMTAAHAQETLLQDDANLGGADNEGAAQPVISAEPSPPADEVIKNRIETIFAEIDELAALEVSVQSGVVNLTGSISSPESGDQAQSIAERVSGVVTVDSNFERDVSVDNNVEPVIDNLTKNVNKFVGALPLIGIAIAIAILISLFGHVLASARIFWNRITPNVFLAELLATSIRVIFIGLGLFVALDILDATAVLGAVLGGAGVIGLAVGFALRDTVDNYVSSIMLSLRQPFRANDHVLIGEREGLVVRLTSRATILMTLDGNHLRIPNSTVFKAEILNYTRNPQRRFTFILGVDADDDPAAAVRTGLKAINSQKFILADPAATAEIREVGDSNILIAFNGWINQQESDFKKARGACIRACKNALENEGFALPEPIYRLRFDGGSPFNINVDGAVSQTTAAPNATKQKPKPMASNLDVTPEKHIEKWVGDERSSADQDDLLDKNQPVE